jgi:dienelactone hydrolase
VQNNQVFIGSVLALLFWGPWPARGEPALTGPWDLSKLKQAPKVTWVDKEGPLRKLYYESEPYHGKPTRVFAYYAQPAKVVGRLPAMVLLHGGGGKAFPQWARLWAERGYVALAMDFGGNGPDGKRLPDAGPGQSDEDKFPRAKTDLREMWSYHAVAAAIRGVSLLSSLPQVDAERIGVTGISWGGYLTCLVAGLDDRLKVAVPVYGCGFLHENSAWLKIFDQLPKDRGEEWTANFDPSRFLKQAKMPMLFVNGTNDSAYPLDSYRKSYRLVANHQLCIKVNMKHGHAAGWAPVEIGLFVDQYLNKGVALPAFKGPFLLIQTGVFIFARIEYASATLVDRAELHWTTDSGPWQKRKWQSQSVRFESGKISARLPDKKPTVFFVSITDKRNATVSSEHWELEQQSN